LPNPPIAVLDKERKGRIEENSLVFENRGKVFYY
jgi:hypothetical protein